MRKYLRDWVDRNFSDPQVLSMVFLLFFMALLIYFFGNMLIPFFAAVIIAYLLEGIVEKLERINMRRRGATWIAFLLFILIVIVFMIGLIPILSRQIGQLLQEVPCMIRDVQHGLKNLPVKYPDFISESQINDVLALIGVEFSKFGQRVLSFSIYSVRVFITLVVYLFLVPLLVFFLLRDKTLVLEWASNFLPENRGMVTEVWNEVNQQFANYLRGKTYEILIVWAASFALFLLLGLNFSMLLSLFVGLSVLIPYVGATFMFFPVTMMAFFQWGVDLHVLYTMIFYIILQMLDGNVLAPLLMAEVVNIHPVAIIVAILLFGGLWGFWGLLFAIPLATLFNAFMKAWWKKIRAQQDAVSA